MKLLSKFVPQKIENSTLWVIAVAQDGNEYYGMLIDPVTRRAWVEKIGLSMSKEELTQYFLRVPEGKDDAEWRAVVDFFEKAHVLDKFFKGQNMVWARKDGKLTPLAEKMREKITKR